MEIRKDREWIKYVLGIDAAWTAKEPSGVAVLKYNESGKHELVKLGRSYKEFVQGEINWSQDASGSVPDIKELLEGCCKYGYNISAAALDIPLSPMPITGRRVAENLISREYGKYGAATHSPNSERPGKISEAIFQGFTENGFKFAYDYQDGPVFFEVYPHAAIIELLGLTKRLPYKVNNKSKYWPDASPEERDRNIINSLVLLKDALGKHVSNIDSFLPEIKCSYKYKNKYLKEYEDILDAIVCALVGCFYLSGKAKPYGDEAGAIWVPKLNEENSKCKIYNKLVRDNIPQIIKNSGSSCEIKIVDKEERYKLLEDKLKEEVDEFLEAKNLEELADVMEVLFGLAESLGYSEEDLVKKRDEKSEERGGFKEGVVLLKVYEGDNQLI